MVAHNHRCAASVHAWLSKYGNLHPTHSQYSFKLQGGELHLKYIQTIHSLKPMLNITVKGAQANRGHRLDILASNNLKICRGGHMPLVGEANDS